MDVANVSGGVEGVTSNAHLVRGERTVLVDARANFDAVGRIRDRAVDLDAVVLTHTHPDHVGTVPDVRAAYAVETWGYDAAHEAVDRALADDGRVRLGDHEFRALHTPGHAPDHLCFYSPTARALFVGDLVFATGAFGRTDLPGGDRSTLVDSIDRVLATVGESLSVLYPGHGPSVTDRPYDDIELARRAARTTGD